MPRTRPGMRVVLLAAALLLASLVLVTEPARAAVAVPRPTITSVSPTSVPVAGGVRVTIRGTSFRNVRRVLVGGKAARLVRVYSTTHLKATVPADTAGLHSVRVVTAAGTSPTSRVARLLYVAPPPPAPPVSPASELTSEVGETSVGLAWQLPSTPRTAVTVRRITGPHAPRTLSEGTEVVSLSAEATTYTDSGLTSGSEYSYAVFVRDGARASVPLTTSVRTLSTMPAGWSQPRTILRPNGKRIVDCLAPRHCVGVDLLGNATEYDGTSWSRPVKIDTSPDNQWRTGFRLLDCASASFCLAIDATVGSRTFDGSRWHGRVPVHQGRYVPSHLSCGSPTFCVVADSFADTYIFDGATWSGPAPLSGPPADSWAIVSLGCTPTTCLAIDGAGRSRQLRGGAWSSPVQAIDESHGTYRPTVSCVRSTWCMLADRALRPRIWDGATWSDGPELSRDPDASWEYTLTCLATDYCLLSAGGSLVYDGSTWQGLPSAGNVFPQLWDPRCDPTSTYCLSPRHNGDPDVWLEPWSGTHGTTAAFVNQRAPEAVACASEDYCHAIGPGAVEMVGDTWHDPIPLPHPDEEHGIWPQAGSPDVLACPEPGRCLLVGGSNQEGSRWWQFDDGAWSRNRLVGDLDEPHGLTAVSCPSPTRCVATKHHHLDGAAVTTWDGSSWSPFVPVAPSSSNSYLEGVSCPSLTFCAAVGGLVSTAYNGQAVTWRAGLGWSAPVGRGAWKYFHAVGCTMDESCVAVGTDIREPQGVVVTYAGGVWSEVDVLDPSLALIGVSCAAHELCVAISDGPTAYLWRDGEWSPPQVLSPGNQLTGVSCPTSRLCVVTDSAGNEFRYTGG